MCENVCFCVEKTIFCGTGGATINELLLRTKYKSKQHNFLPKFCEAFVGRICFNFFVFNK